MPVLLRKLLTLLCCAGIPLAHAAPPGPPEFESIFDGTLKNWEGDPTYWRAEDGVLIGEVREQNPSEQNSFIIWRGGEVEDFELMLDYRISANGKAGIDYRGIHVPESDGGQTLKSYQADLDGSVKMTGQISEIRGRGVLSPRGKKTILPAPPYSPEVTDLADPSELQERAKTDDWNSLHLIVKAGTHQYILNGSPISELWDLVPAVRRLTGLLGAQVHLDAPMKIELRDIRLKRLENRALYGFGKITSSRFVVTINNCQLLPEEHDKFRKAYESLLAKIQESGREGDTRYEESKQDLQRMNETVKVTIVTEFKLSEVFDDALASKPGDTITVIQSTNLLHLLKGSEPFPDKDSTTTVHGIVQSYERVNGLGPAFSAIRVMPVNVRR